MSSLIRLFGYEHVSTSYRHLLISHMGTLYSDIYWYDASVQRDSLSEATVTSRTVVTFVTCLISRTEFLVYKGSITPFYSKFISCISRRIESEVSCGLFCCNESTFVTDDLAQCLYNVLSIMRCAFGVRLDFGLAGRPTTTGFISTVHVSLPSFWGRWPSFDLTEPLVMSPVHVR